MVSAIPCDIMTDRDNKTVKIKNKKQRKNDSSFISLCLELQETKPLSSPRSYVKILHPLIGSVFLGDVIELLTEQYCINWCPVSIKLPSFFKQKKKKILIP